MYRYISTFLVSAIPGAVAGCITYTLIEINPVLACSFAGLIIAIATGVPFYISKQSHKDKA